MIHHEEMRELMFLHKACRAWPCQIDPPLLHSSVKSNYPVSLSCIAHDGWVRWRPGHGVNSGDYRRNVGGYYGSGDNYRRYVGGYSGGGNDCGCSVGGYDGGGDGNYGRDVRGYDGGGGCYGDGGYSSSRIVESTFAIAYV
jgi:hypothetical protein